MAEEQIRVYHFDRLQVEHQIIQNLAEAGIIEANKTFGAVKAVKMLDNKDLIALLLESHMMKEAAPEKKQFFFIDWDAMCPN